MVRASARPRAALSEAYLFSAGVAWWLQALQASGDLLKGLQRASRDEMTRALLVHRVNERCQAAKAAGGFMDPQGLG
jgi:hypothetical protein